MRSGHSFLRSRACGPFEQAGLSAKESAQFAATLIAASEGAVVLARAEQSLEPFELVADHLLEQVRKLSMG
jgi:hypothetical protein